MRTRTQLVAAMATTALIGGVLAGCSSPAASPSGGSSQPAADGIGPITFASGKDLTGAMPQLIDVWNKQHPDRR